MHIVSHYGYQRQLIRKRTLYCFIWSLNYIPRKHATTLQLHLSKGLQLVTRHIVHAETYWNCQETHTLVIMILNILNYSNKYYKRVRA